MSATRRHRSTRSISSIPARFAARGYPDDVWTQLRAEAPVAWFEPAGYEPFWAITKHADIIDVASQPVRFSNEHGLILGPIGAPSQPIEMVVTLDPPRHGPLRRVAMRRLTPRAIRSRNDEIERIAVEVLDGIAAAADGGERVRLRRAHRRAAPDRRDRLDPRRAPRPTGELLFRWTNEVIGKDDPEFRRPGETPGQTIRRARVRDARLPRRAHRSSAGASPATTSSASSSRRRSTASR